MPKPKVMLAWLLFACSGVSIGCNRDNSVPTTTPVDDELVQFLESKTTKDLKFVHHDVLETNSAEFPYEARVTAERLQNGVRRRVFVRCEYRGGKWEFAKGSDPTSPAK